jgi:hypothetical protein
MGIVSARSFHAKSVRPSLPSVNDGVRLGTTFRPLSNAAYQRIPRSMTSSVNSKLSRSDFVQAGLSEVEKGKALDFPTLETNVS